MKTLFNDGFSFLLMDAGTEFEEFLGCKDKCESVKIPHDWTIADAHRFYEDGMGCYLKYFEYSFSDDKARVFLRFDGVYMNAKIYLNSILVGEWKYGYTSFVVDISKALQPGKNELVVMVDYRCPNSRWYSGAGIYRNVWLIEEHEVFIPDNGIYIHSNPLTDDLEGDWEVKLSVELSKDWSENISLDVSFSGEEKLDIDYVSECVSGNTYLITYIAKKPKLWSIDNPFLYTLEVSLFEDGNKLQTQTLDFGFRQLKLTTDRGAFLNGKYLKLNGACEHHDFGCLGACFYPDAWKRKLCKLREMGVNAIRLAHNPSDPLVYEICDKEGLLLISEAFDMWERPKTEYDYARFFKEWHERDVERWVKDARNHPSVVFYSIGNEIYDTHEGERGREVAKDLASLVKHFDPYTNAYTTIGSNYIPWENTQKVADDLKIIGYNYAEKLYKEHHEEHPDWIIYGSETCSIVFSRGVYHFPFAADILAEDDLQCSALGNSATSWGARSLEKCNIADRDTPFSLGQFIWTGHDYIGEPTPYHTKNSYFGMLDTAGFPKDSFYMWKAAWTDGKKSPFVHVYPYWCFNVGQMIDIRVCSNCDSTELIVNGISKGRVKLKDNVANFQALYEPGYIEAIAYDESGNEVSRMRRASFGETSGLDVVETVFGKLHFFEIQAIDIDNNPVENACDKVCIEVLKGEFLGTDNGDSTDFDSYKSQERFLFRGKLLAVVSANEEGIALIDVKLSKESKRVRDVQMAVESIDESIHVIANVLPSDAKNKEVEFALSDLHGNVSNLSKLTYESKEGQYKVDITPIGDGDYILRAVCKDGFDHAKVISILQFKNEGLGQLCVDPYNFVAGSTYSRFKGEVTSGNERGVASARDGETVIIFENVDFGTLGSKNINIPIFGLSSDPYELEIWKGVPGEEGAILLNNDGYHKPSIWNVYQAEDYVFNQRIKGICTISFRMWTKMHIKGFTCFESNPIEDRLYAAFADKVYGDQFEIKEKTVENIGNNVTVDFGEFDFGEGGKKIVICGRDRNGINTLHLRFSNKEDEIREIIEFLPSGDSYDEQIFDIVEFKGYGRLEIVFLPGCSYDLYWIEIR